MSSTDPAAVTLVAKAPASVCTSPNCLRLAAAGGTRCPAHQAQREADRAAYLKVAHKDYNARRPASDKFYWTNTWKKKSAAYRVQHPLCEECDSIGLVVPSTMVDHRIPYRERPDLGLDDSNLRALCWQCHNRIGKKVRDDQAAESARPAILGRF